MNAIILDGKFHETTLKDALPPDANGRDIKIIPIQDADINKVGWVYDDVKKIFVKPNVIVGENIGKPYQPTNAEIAQLISDLQAEIEIRGL